MRFDNVMKVNAVRGEARIPDVLNTEPALPPCHRSPHRWQGQGAGMFRGCPIYLGARALLLLYLLLPCPPFSPQLQNTPGRKLREERQAHCVLGPGTGDLSHSAPL